MLLWVAAGVALGCGAPEPGVFFEVAKGWTEDGRYVAYEHRRYAYDDETGDELEGRFAAVFDTKTETTTHYLLESDPQTFSGLGAHADPFRAAQPSSAWEVWTASHPLVAGGTAPSCADRAVYVDEEDLGGYGITPGVWKDGKRDIGSQLGNRSVVIGVERGGVRTLHFEASLAPTSPFASTTLALSWSPRCTHLLYGLMGYALPHGGMDRYGPDDAVQVLPAGPVIHIMAHQTAERTVEPVFGALTAAGFSPHVGPHALKDRGATVVYTRPEAKEEAALVAAAIPGGATIEALTWKSAADMVVATGTSVPE
jgi:hypothetical protein